MDELRQPRLRPVDRSRVVPATRLEDLISHDHPARAIWDYVGVLDLTALTACIRAVEGVPGRNATDPKILVAMWMWATADGIGSARAIERLCEESNPYKWLAGGVSLNYHLLATFRSRHEEVLNDFLEAHVAALLHQGLIELACVAQDGMRTRASAGAGSFRRRTTIEECQQLVREQLEQLRRSDDEPLGAVARRSLAARKRHAEQRRQRLAAAAEVAQQLQAKLDDRRRTCPKEAARRGLTDDSARASTTDPESRRMKMADGGTRPAYNVQLATTVGTGVVVGVAVSDQGTDSGLMGAMLEQIEGAYGSRPAEYLVDGGYSSKADVESAHGRGTAVYSPLRNEKKDLKSGKDPYAPGRGDGAGVRAWRKRMGTAEGKAKYKRRGETAEWVNAGMRERGLYRVTVRGREKVRAAVVLHALVHNLFQTIRLCRARKPGRKWVETLRAGLERKAKGSGGRQLG